MTANILGYAGVLARVYRECVHVFILSNMSSSYRNMYNVYMPRYTPKFIELIINAVAIDPAGSQYIN